MANIYKNNDKLTHMFSKMQGQTRIFYQSDPITFSDVAWYSKLGTL